jgi:hypothetical protein
MSGRLDGGSKDQPGRRGSERALPHGDGVHGISPAPGCRRGRGHREVAAAAARTNRLGVRVGHPQLVTKDHGYGGSDPGFGVVYVINGVVEGAEVPGKSVEEQKPEKPFDRQLQRGLRKALKDLPPVKFVKGRSSVLPGKPPSFGRYCSMQPASCRVINNGVLLTLGPIQGDTGRVEVGNSLWINLLHGRWGTYVLKRQGGGWEVTGTTGPEAVS